MSVQYVGRSECVENRVENESLGSSSVVRSFTAIHTCM